MPVILSETDKERWSAPLRDTPDMNALMQLIRPYPTEAMIAYPAAPLLGKGGSGNSIRASTPFAYPGSLLADPLA